MAKYQLKKDFYYQPQPNYGQPNGFPSGVVLETFAPVNLNPVLVFKKGDVIDGNENYTTGLNKSLKSVSTSSSGNLTLGGSFYEIPIEYLQKVNDSTPVSTRLNSILNLDTKVSYDVVRPSEKELRDAKYPKQEIKISSTLKLVGALSIIPLGLYAFSKHRGYDVKKTTLIVGSAIALELVLIQGLPGFSWKRYF